MEYVVELDKLKTYAPPMHDGTLNRRIVPADLGAGIEVVHGTLASGGTATRHKHATEWQIIILQSGEAILEIGDAPRQTLTAGAVVRIPPDTAHYFEVTSEEPAKVIVIYSPPLGENGFIAA